MHRVFGRECGTGLTALAFHPSTAVLASGADDLQVLLREPQSSACPFARGRVDETVTGLAWGNGGDRLLGIDAMGTVPAWQFRPSHGSMIN